MKVDEVKICEIAANQFKVNFSSVELLHIGFNTCGINSPNMYEGKRILESNSKAMCCIFTLVSPKETNVAYAIIDSESMELLHSAYINEKRTNATVKEKLEKAM